MDLHLHPQKMYHLHLFLNNCYMIDKYASLKNCTYAIVVSSSYRKNAHKFYENIGFRDEVVGFRKLYK